MHRFKREEQKTDVWSDSKKIKRLEKKKNTFFFKGMVEMAYLIWEGGACLLFWFKSFNFLAARLIRDQNSWNKIKLNLMTSTNKKYFNYGFMHIKQKLGTQGLQ